MLTQYHIEITLHALGARVSPRALAAIINANIYQDRIAGMFFHNEYHFDNNDFEKSYAYVEEQRALTLSSLRKNEAHPAWAAFGRMTHTVQDFYAHSNYITLWLDRFDKQTLPAPPKVDALDPGVIHSPSLRSSKTYYPFEYLYFHQKTKKFSLNILPKDSHAWMNLDAPEQGFQFEYALHAAIQRTLIEFENTAKNFTETMSRLFMDM